MTTTALLDPKSGVEREYSAVVMGKVNMPELRGKLQSGIQTASGVYAARLEYAEEITETEV